MAFIHEVYTKTWFSFYCHSYHQKYFKEKNPTFPTCTGDDGGLEYSLKVGVDVCLGVGVIPGA